MNKKKLVYLTLYALAMAYLEAAVVVYLRQLWGIADLLTSNAIYDPFISIVELGRELATLIMLFAVGLAAGKKLQSQVGFAIYIFGIWDICYYAWLKILIGFLDRFWIGISYFYSRCHGGGQCSRRS